MQLIFWSLKFKTQCKIFGPRYFGPDQANEKSKISDRTRKIFGSTGTDRSGPQILVYILSDGAFSLKCVGIIFLSFTFITIDIKCCYEAK